MQKKKNAIGKKILFFHYLLKKKEVGKWDSNMIILILHKRGFKSLKQMAKISFQLNKPEDVSYLFSIDQ